MKGLYSLQARVFRVGLLVAMFLIVGNQTAHSQIFDYAYAEDVNFTGLLEGSVIRGYGTSNAVVLFWDQGIQYFGLLVDGTTVYNADKVPSSLLINDFQIIGSKVFFCGKHLQDGPIVGWFDINDLILGIGATYDYKSFPQCNTKNLYKLAVASVPGDYSIMALGTSFSAPATYMDQAVYIPLYNSSGLNYMYEAYLNDGMNPNHMFDVVATDNYFAVIGCKMPSDFTLTIRRLQIGDLDLSAFSDCYDYVTSYAFIDYSRAVSLEQDYIAVASINVPPSLMSSEAYTLVYTIDLSTMYTNMVAAQEFKIPWKANPTDMIYLSQYQQLVLTAPMILVGYDNISGFIYLDPFAVTGYAAPVYYKDGVYAQYSLTGVNGNVLVASAGLSWFYLEHTLLNIPAECIKNSMFMVDKENIISPLPLQPGVSQYSSSENSVNVLGCPGLRYLQNTCIEQ